MNSQQDPQKRVSDLLLWSDPAAKQLMENIAKEHQVSLDVLAKLVAWERDQQERARKRGMTDVFDEIFGTARYWK